MLYREVEEKIKSHDASLAENKNKGKNKKKAFVTLMDDDGRKAWFDNGHDTILRKYPNAKVTFALNPIQFGAGGANYLTDEQLTNIKNDTIRYEVVNHGWYGEPLNYTLEQLWINYNLEKNKMIEYGFNNYDYYVYSGYTPPASISNGDFKNRLRQLPYKCCMMNEGSKDNYLPFESFEIKRMNAYGGQTTKDYIDYCIENNMWCVLFGHAWMSSQNSTNLDTTLAYIEEKVNAGLIEYVTVKEMVDKYENIIEVGNGIQGGDYFICDKNGNVDFSIKGESINKIYKDFTNKNVIFSKTAFTNKPLTDYPINSIVIESITNSEAVKLGLPDAGIIETVRYKVTPVVAIDSFHRQTYTQTGTGQQFQRVWKTQKGSDIWYPFEPLSQVSLSSRPRYGSVGSSIFDINLSKPIWCKTKGHTPNKILARSTSYNYGDVVNYTGNFGVICIKAGTTSDVAPSFDSNAKFTDGTVEWLYLGNVLAVWIDSSGTIV